ncbi:hypothetical protein Q9L58_008950 [Maublancomyces gigas]|uniref:Uncharacterized protein n=1 Tax=Discina gigas TaxID=1032678 RepID=A0ABR3G8W9_9PEZI
MKRKPCSSQSDRLEATRKRVKLAGASRPAELKLDGCFSPAYDRLIRKQFYIVSPEPSPNTPLRDATLLPLGAYTNLPEGHVPKPMPTLPATPLGDIKTKAEILEEKIKLQREMAADIYLQAKHQLLKHSNKQLPKVSLVANGRVLFGAIRKTFLRVLKRKSESQWLSTLDSQAHEELFQALLLVSLKSVVTDRKKIKLWKVGGRLSKLQKELRSENTKAIELAQTMKDLGKQINMNTYDRKRRRLGKVLLPGVYLGEPRDFNLRSRPFSVSHKTPKSISPAKPQEWPNFKITTVFKPETGNMPRACLDGGDVFNRVLPEVLTPMLRRYGASDQKHRVFSKTFG